MRGLTGVVAGVAGLLLTGFADPAPPPKPQPGSWSMKMDLIDARGPGADKVKAAMAQMLAAMNKMSVCITPRDSANADPMKNIASGNRDCTFDRRQISAAGIHVAGTCSKRGVASTISADGTISATAQDITITTETRSPKGGGMMMKMRMRTRWTGPCKPGDVKSPQAA